MENNLIIGDVAVEAVGAAEERCEELDEAKRLKLLRRRQTNRSGREAVGRELLVVMKMMLASLMVLCVLTVVCVLKK